MCDFIAAAVASSTMVSVADMLGQSSVGELNEYELSYALQEGMKKCRWLEQSYMMTKFETLTHGICKLYHLLIVDGRLRRRIHLTVPASQGMKRNVFTSEHRRHVRHGNTNRRNGPNV